MDLSTDSGFFDLLTASHLQFVGRPLVPAQADARWLYEDAPFGLLAHDADADPTFVYANLTAQRAFEYDWDEFTGLRSRLSAEPQNQEDRDRLLDAVARDNFFMWTLIHPDGRPAGQAATFSRWTEA